MPMALKKQSSWETSGLITGTRTFAKIRKNQQSVHIVSMRPPLLSGAFVENTLARPPTARDQNGSLLNQKDWCSGIAGGGETLVAASRGDTSTTYELCMSCSARSTSKCQSV